MAFQSNAPIQHQQGISLYTMLAAVVVLGLLTAALVTQFDSSHSKGVAAYAMLTNIGNGAIRFHTDTGCYPGAPSALMDFDEVATHNSCHHAIDEIAWHGPYIKSFPTNSDGSITADQFGPGVHIKFENNINGRDVDAIVYFTNLPSDIANEAYSACGGSGSQCHKSGSQLKLTYAQRQSP